MRSIDIHLLYVWLTQLTSSDLSVHRAEEVDLVLELEGLHKKEINGKMSGSVRVLLKTEDDRDQICISDAIWEPEKMPLSQQVCWP